MTLFHPDSDTRSSRHRKIYAYCEVAYTTDDFLAAVLFIVGSVLLFKETTAYVATWLFVVGSVFFGLRPTIKLVRELCYLRIGDYEDIAKE